MVHLCEVLIIKDAGSFAGEEGLTQWGGLFKIYSYQLLKELDRFRFICEVMKWTTKVPPEARVYLGSGSQEKPPVDLFDSEIEPGNHVVRDIYFFQKPYVDKAIRRDSHFSTQFQHS